jgi:hypothetical protein
VGGASQARRASAEDITKAGYYKPDLRETL